MNDNLETLKAELPRAIVFGRDERGRLVCPHCGGGIFMPEGTVYQCRVCEARFVECQDGEEGARA